MSEADLFVVCKNCGSEVSPYVTECPYCGQRVRKRAPKIDRVAEPDAPPKRRRRAPTLPRLRRDEIPGIAPETRPYATGLLIVLALGASVAWGAGILSLHHLGAVEGPIGKEWWRLLATGFIQDNAGVAFATLVAVGIFATHLERRFGAPAAVGIFLAGGAGGAALSVALKVYPAIGANGPALALLAAWIVDDRLADRRGADRGSDLLGVAAIAALLLLLPLADTRLSWVAGLGGAGAGAAIGALISPLRR